MSYLAGYAFVLFIALPIWVHICRSNNGFEVIDMKFPNELFLNDETDLLWLELGPAAHLQLPEFESFIVFGHRDAPVKIELYARKKPLHNDHPIMVLVQDENGDLNVMEGA
jgi:hypothetical protein